jgi:hypothetical protein
MIPEVFMLRLVSGEIRPRFKASHFFPMKLGALLVCFLSLGLMATASPPQPNDARPGLAGQWTLDVAKSSPIRPWDHETITITTNSDSVTLVRHLAWGTDRKVSDTTTVKTDGVTATSNPVGYWLDTWYTNVYIGGDHRKQVVGEWLDGGRVLKLETRLKLEAQQGDHDVHLYDEFRLSADGRTLKLYELRSTRDEAMVYVFTRD